MTPAAKARQMSRYSACSSSTTSTGDDGGTVHSFHADWCSVVWCACAGQIRITPTLLLLSHLPCAFRDTYLRGTCPRPFSACPTSIYLSYVHALVGCHVERLSLEGTSWPFGKFPLCIDCCCCLASLFSPKSIPVGVFGWLEKNAKQVVRVSCSHARRPGDAVDRHALGGAVLLCQQLPAVHSPAGFESLPVRGIKALE